MVKKEEHTQNLEVYAESEEEEEEMKDVTKEQEGGKVEGCRLNEVEEGEEKGGGGG